MKDFITIDDGVYFDLLTSSLFFKELPDIKNRKHSYEIIREQRQLNQNNQLMAPKNKRKIQVINIVPTTRCDGRCLYCYNENENNTIEISDLTVDKMISYIEELEADGVDMDHVTNIRFYGGEPLLNTQFYDIAMYLHNRYHPTMHISSGLLFSDSHFQTCVLPALIKLKENDVNFAVTTTVDFGSVPYTRIYKNKTVDSYSVIMNRMEILKENNIPIVYATVVNKYTDIDIMAKQIKETYESLNMENEFDLNTETTIRPVAFRLSVANHDVFKPTLEQLDKLYNGLQNIYDSFPVVSNLYPYTDVICGAKIVSVKDDTDIFAFVFPSSRCGIYTYMVEIFPNGLGNCHMNLLDNDINFSNKSPVYKRLTTNTACKNCNYELVCRKGCCYRKEFAQTSIDVYCQWIRYSFELAWKRVYKICNNDKDVLKKYVKDHINEMVGII